MNVFRRRNTARLDGEKSGIPLAVFARRSHARTGFTSALTTLIRGHVIKTGIELSRLSPHEALRFTITDLGSAEAHEISPAAQRFVTGHPFLFGADRTASAIAGFFQSTLSLTRRLHLDAGVRYDRTTLPLAEQAWSPRIGLAFSVPSSNTTVRASYNRFFMPPQVENVLLATSEQARQLSPFAAIAGGGTLRAERSSAYEIGLEQRIGNVLKANFATWWRRFKDVADPNVFFNTTLIIPNSVDSGRARGVDLRFELSPTNRWLGYVSYSNQNVVQFGPIRGGMFLTDEFIEIGPGTRFAPDHDQRNTATAGLTYFSGWHGLWATLAGRYQSGVPLEVTDETLLARMATPGAEFVNFDRRRVKPWATFDIAAGIVWKRRPVTLEPRFEVFNLFDRGYVYNFGNPFSGTHFGTPRVFQAGLRIHYPATH
jgi:outer membrane receptor protein involved in Fe transport